MKMYRRYTANIQSKGSLIPVNEVPKGAGYFSLFKYNDTQKAKSDGNNGSIAGITDVVGNLVFFDFDDANNVGQALEDCRTAVDRLINAGVSEHALDVYFSGMKGFSLMVETENDFITPEIHAAIIENVAGDLQTTDKVISNASRMVRAPLGMHEKSGLWKRPLSLDQLFDLNVDQIKELAGHLSNLPVRTTPLQLVTDFPAELRKVKVKIQPATPAAGLLDINFSNKPAFLSNCKYALLQGEIPQGQRQNALLALAATYKNIGHSKDETYDALKGALRRATDKHGEGSTSKADIWNNILPSVFNSNWQGGTYSCRSHPWMKSYCETLGNFACSHSAHKDDISIKLPEAAGPFQTYAENYENNVLKFGIKALDDNCSLMVGTSTSWLAAPSAGKTSAMFQVLNHNSLMGNKCLFFSLDMYHATVYTSLARRHSREIVGDNKFITNKEVFEAFKTRSPMRDKILEIFEREYKNVDFCFKSGISAEGLGNAITDVEQKIGDKLRLVVIDYSQLIMTNLSDETAASALVANTLRKVANDTSTAILTLFQPNKANTDPRKEITNYTSAKGSGVIGEAAHLFITQCRPGWGTKRDENDQSLDRFASFSAVKNREGPLFTADCGWHGPTGTFFDLTDEERGVMKKVKESVAAEKNGGIIPKEPY